MRLRFLAFSVITELFLQFGGFAHCIAQTDDIDTIAAAHAFLVATRAAEQLLDGFKRYPPSSDDYIEQFADDFPTRRRDKNFAKPSIASSQRSLAKP